MKKITMIGCGNVGATTLFALINANCAEEYYVIDQNEKLSLGQIMDLQDSTTSSKLYLAKYSDYGVKESDVVIITAGRNQKPNESRDALLYDNAAIVKNIIENLNKINYKGLIMIASNPVDIMTAVAIKYSKLPKERIIGTGTVLDTNRLINLFGKENVQFVIGEHGDSSVSVINQTSNKLTADREDINNEVRKRAGNIISNKGYTAFGIAGAITQIIKIIDRSKNNFVEEETLLVSSYIPMYDVCTSIPTIISASGIVKYVLPANFTQNEYPAFLESVAKIKNNSQKLFQELERN